MIMLPLYSQKILQPFKLLFSMGRFNLLKIIKNHVFDKQVNIKIAELLIFKIYF